MKTEFTIESSHKLDLMTVEEKIEYYENVKQYILSLPFNEKELVEGEKKFLQTVNFIVPKFKKVFEPTITSRISSEFDEPHILISNHLNSFDQVLLSSAFPNVAYHYMIAESLLKLKNLRVGKLYLSRGAFVVDRTTSEGRKLAIPNALKYLYRNNNIAMFPEASRQIRYGSDGSVQEFKNGAVQLAQMASVPIIPVAINNNFKKGELYINVGEKFSVNIEDNIIEKTNDLRNKVIELWEENRDRGALILTKNKK